MSWKDRLIMKMLGNKVVIKIFSIPIVIKIMTWMAQAFMAVASIFKRKKEPAA